MDAPMPPDLDVSKILLLSLGTSGTPKVERLNMEFTALGG
jgi:hypothetical protein